MLEKDLTKIEVKIMKIIWDSERKLHLKEITEQVNECFGSTWHPQTISTYLMYLIKKGYLSMERHGRVFLYTAEITEQEFLKKKMEDLFAYHSEYRLIDFLQMYPKEAFTNEVIKKMKNMLQEN